MIKNDKVYVCFEPRAPKSAERRKFRKIMNLTKFAKKVILAYFLAFCAFLAQNAFLGPVAQKLVGVMVS